MNAVEIEQAISELALQPFDAAEFPFTFMAAFGNKDTTLKRLRTGNNNASDVVGGVLLRNNIHLAVCPAGAVGDTLKALRASLATTKASQVHAQQPAAVQPFSPDERRAGPPQASSHRSPSERRHSDEHREVCGYRRCVARDGVSRADRSGGCRLAAAHGAGQGDAVRGCRALSLPAPGLNPAPPLLHHQHRLRPAKARQAPRGTLRRGCPAI